MAIVAVKFIEDIVGNFDAGDIRGKLVLSLVTAVTVLTTLMTCMTSVTCDTGS